MIACFLGMVLTTTAAQTEKPLILNSTKQLFLDDCLIASQTNIKRTIHPARKHPDNPILVATEPWEGNVVLIYGSVIREGSKFRMWYYTPGALAYAESDDGLHWRKPLFDFIKHNGEKTNLLVKLRDSRDGKVIAESLPVVDDGLDIPVQWKTGDIKGIDEPVTLRINLKNGLLFALWCG